MSEAAAFERCLAAGGVAVFGADTVYGLACDPRSAPAVRRLRALKGREDDKPAAVMFFALELALGALPGLGPRTREALARLLPGPVTLVLPDPARSFPLAGGPDPASVGLRVPALGESPLAAVRRPVLQSSANRAGGPEARRLADVPAPIRAGADLELDAGELPGTASTVIDLRAYEEEERWVLLRPGALGVEAVERALG